MNNLKKFLVGPRKRVATGLALALLVAGSGITAYAAHKTTMAAVMGKQVATTQAKFYCNIKALTPEERARHKQLTERLMALRKETVETAKGYEFQFNPKSVSLAELASWVSEESKCCPFFDFHIDLEAEGNMLCLRLTGEDGIKAFIQAEFRVPPK